MGAVTYNAALGKPFFEGSSSFRTKDDASDNKGGGVYSHLALEFSGTEAGEYQSFFMFLIQLLAAGTAAVRCRNQTGSQLDKGTLVYISGYSAAQSRLLIAAAEYDDAAKPALFVLDADIATAANGTVYGAATVTGLDTSGASAVGDPVYLGAAGAWTLTAPSGTTQFKHEIGRVTIKDGSNGAIAFYPAAKFIQQLPSGALPSNVTLKGNSFNGVSQLVETNGSGKIATATIVADAALSANVALENLANAFTKAQTVQVDADASKPLILKGNSATQSGNLLECQTSAGALLRGVGPKGAEIGETGIQSWHAASKPATRLDGTALVAGDRVYHTGSKLWYYWDGTSWLSEEIFNWRSCDAWRTAGISGAGGSDDTSNIPANPFPSTNHNIYILDMTAYAYPGELQDGSSHHNLLIYGIVNDEAGTATGAGMDTSGMAAGGWRTKTGAINYLVDTTSLNLLHLHNTKDGTVSTLYLWVTTRYRFALR